MIEVPRSADRKALVDVVVIVRGKRELLEIVQALGAAGRLAGRLHGR